MDSPSKTASTADNRTEQHFQNSPTLDTLLGDLPKTASAAQTRTGQLMGIV